MTTDIKIEQVADNIYMLRNVPIVYASLKNYTENDTDNGKVKVYKATAIVPEDIADEWDTLGFAKPESKKVVRKKDDKTFEERYKMPLPSWASEAKNYSITLTQNAARKVDGEEVLWEDHMNARPKVEMMVDGVRTNITDKLIGNGSIGDIAVRTYESKYGVQAKLGGIMIKELVEVEMKANAGYVDPFAEYGEAPDIPVFESQEPVKEKVESAKKNQEKPEGLGDDFDSDVSF